MHQTAGSVRVPGPDLVTRPRPRQSPPRLPARVPVPLTYTNNAMAHLPYTSITTDEPCLATTTNDAAAPLPAPPAANQYLPWHDEYTNIDNGGTNDQMQQH